MFFAEGKQYNVGEKPNVVLYTTYYVDRHRGKHSRLGTRLLFGICDTVLGLGLVRSVYMYVYANISNGCASRGPPTLHSLLVALEY